MYKSRSVICCFLLLIIALTSIEALPRKCPRNEFYTDCGNACQTECATLGDECLIRYIRCPDGCYCNEGYARDANRKCIPISQCPPKK
ncbi:venom serine protease inhibitor-like [Cochliomyia hominivorax]